MCPICGFGTEPGEIIDARNVVFVSGTKWEVHFKLEGERGAPSRKSGQAPNDGYDTWLSTVGKALEAFKYKVFRITTNSSS